MQAFLKFYFGPIMIGSGGNRRQIYDVLCYYPNGSPEKVPVPRENRRSRGRHEPGSSKYWNRWVFGTQVNAKYNGVEYPVSFNDDYSPYEGDSTMRHIVGSATYDGTRIVCVSLDRYRGSSGTQPYYRVGCYLYAWYDWQSNRRRFRYCYTTWSRDYAGTDEGYDAARAYYESLAAYRVAPPDGPLWGSHYRGFQYGVTRVNGDLIDSELKFSSRPEIFEDEIDLGIGAGRVFNSLVANAYVDMVDNLPDMSGMSNAVNAIQLVKAGLGVIKGLYTGDPTLTIGTLSDAWLGYRYSFMTTKADLEEAASYFSRAFDLLDVDDFRCNGSASRSLGEGDHLLARCSMEFGVSSLAGLKSTIERYGMQLDAYAAWDLVPFSFVADWFLGIGDRLEYARSQNFARRVVPSECWCSIERRWTNEFGFPEIYYYRWMGQPDVSRSEYVKHATSGVTIVKRAVDVLALLA